MSFIYRLKQYKVDFFFKYLLTFLPRFWLDFDSINPINFNFLV